MDKPEADETKVEEAEGGMADRSADGEGGSKGPPSPVSVTVIPAPLGAGSGFVR
jgi:hypothetical protein